MADLRKQYNLFSVRWNEWLNHKRNDEYLSQEEVYALTVYIKNNFEIRIDEHVMFYHKTELIKSISNKLKLSSTEFKKWLVEQWQFTLIKKGLEIDLMLFLKTDVAELKIRRELKVVLKKFNRNTLGDLFNRYSEKEFIRGNLFELVLEYMTVLADKKNGIHPIEIMRSKNGSNDRSETIAQSSNEE